jgi:Ca2+-binding EF-hand superfamily protein
MDQLEEILRSTDTKEDEDGMINYDVFTRKILAGPFPDKD